jgi:Mrp family chromosome partitioning ATPase
MTGLALSFMRDGASPTVRTTDDVESRLGVPVVCNIPRLKNMVSPGLKSKRIYRKKCQELMAEILMTQHRPAQRRGRSLGIIGVDVCAGASTLAVNLAISSDVDCHLKTVLVDADSRNRSVSEMFGLNGVPGLVELLRGTASHEECLQKVEDGKIELIASSADSCDEMLSHSAAEIEQALETYLQDCDLLIVDLPAASQPDQAVALAQHLDCILIVAESEKTQTLAADRLLNRLHHCNTEVIGVVLTKTRSYLPRFIRSFVAPQV